MGSSKSKPAGTNADSRPSARFNSGIPYLDQNMEKQVTLQRTFSHNCISLMATSEYGFASDILPTKSPDFISVRLFNSYVTCSYDHHQHFNMTVCFDDTTSNVTSEAYPYGSPSYLKYAKYCPNGYATICRNDLTDLHEKIEEFGKKTNFYSASEAMQRDFFIHSLQKYYTNVSGTTFTKTDDAGCFQTMKIMNSYFSGDFFPNVLSTRIDNMDDARDVYFHLNTTSDTVDHQHDFGPLLPAINTESIRSRSWTPKSIFQKDVFGNRIIENGEYALAGRPTHFTIYKFDAGKNYIANFNICRNYAIGIASLPTIMTAGKLSGKDLNNYILEAQNNKKEEEEGVWETREQYETTFYNTNTQKKDGGMTDESYNLKNMARYTYELSSINTGSSDQSLYLPLLWIDLYKAETEDTNYNQVHPYNYIHQDLLNFEYRDNCFSYPNRNNGNSRVEIVINKRTSKFEDGEGVENDYDWCTYKDGHKKGDGYWWAGPSSRYLAYIMNNDNRNYSYSETNTRGEFMCSYHELVKYTNARCITKFTPTQLAIDSVDADFWARYIHRHGLYWKNRMVSAGNTNYENGEELSAVELYYTNLEEAMPTDAVEIAEDFPLNQKFCIGYNIYGIPNESIQITNSRERINMDLLIKFSEELSGNKVYTIGKSRDQMSDEMRNLMTFYKPSSIMFSKGVSKSRGRPNMARYTLHGMFDSRVPWAFDNAKTAELVVRSNIFYPFSKYSGSAASFYNMPQSMFEPGNTKGRTAVYTGMIIEGTRNLSEAYMIYPNYGPFAIHDLNNNKAHNMYERLDYSKAFIGVNYAKTKITDGYRSIPSGVSGRWAPYVADVSPDLVAVPWKNNRAARAAAGFEMGFSKDNSPHTTTSDLVQEWNDKFSLSLYQSLFYVHEAGKYFVVPYMYKFFCSPESNNDNPLQSFPTWYSEAVNYNGMSVNLNGICNQPTPMLGSRILDYACMQLDPEVYRRSIAIIQGKYYEPELTQRRYYPSYTTSPGAFLVSRVVYSEPNEYQTMKFTLKCDNFGSVTIDAHSGTIRNEVKDGSLAYSNMGFYRTRSDGEYDIIPAGSFYKYYSDTGRYEEVYPYDVQLMLLNKYYKTGKKLKNLNNFTSTGDDFSNERAKPDNFEITVDSMNLYCVNKIVAKDYEVVDKDILLTLEKSIVAVYLELNGRSVRERYYNTKNIFASKIVHMYQVGRRQEIFPGTAPQIFTDNGEVRVSNIPLPIWYDDAEFWWKHEVRNDEQHFPWKTGKVTTDGLTEVVQGTGRPLLRVRGLYEDPRVAIMYDAPSPNLIHFDDMLKLPSQKVSREQVGTACSYYHPYTSPETFVNFGYNSMFSEKFISKFRNRVVFNVGTNSAMVNTVRQIITTGNYLMFESFLSLYQARFVEACVGSRFGDTRNYDMMFAVHQMQYKAPITTRITMPNDTNQAIMCSGVHFLLEKGRDYYIKPNDGTNTRHMTDDLCLTIMFIFVDALMSCKIDQMPGLMKIWQKYCIITGVPVVQLTGIISLASCVTYLNNGKQKSLHEKVCHGMNISRMDVSFENDQVKANVENESADMTGFGYKKTENGYEETSGPFEKLSASPVAVMERCAISVAIDSFKGILGPTNKTSYSRARFLYHDTDGSENYSNEPKLHIGRIYLPDLIFENANKTNVTNTDVRDYVRYIRAQYIEINETSTTSEPIIAKAMVGKYSLTDGSWHYNNLDPGSRSEISPLTAVPFIRDIYASVRMLPMFALYRSASGTISTTIGSSSGVKYTYCPRMTWEPFSIFNVVEGFVVNPRKITIQTDEKDGSIQSSEMTVQYLDKTSGNRTFPMSTVPTEVMATANKDNNYSVIGHSVPITRASLAGFTSQFTALWSYDELRCLMAFFAIYLEENNDELYKGTSPFSDFYTFPTVNHGNTWMSMKNHDLINSDYQN